MFRISKAEVAPFYIVVRGANGRRAREVAGFCLVRSVLPGSDEMWETVTHPAVFRTEQRARAFATRVNARAEFNFSEWVFSGHPCSPLAATDVAPYSVLS